MKKNRVSRSQNPTARPIRGKANLGIVKLHGALSKIGTTTDGKEIFIKELLSPRTVVTISCLFTSFWCLMLSDFFEVMTGVRAVTCEYSMGWELGVLLFVV